MNPFKRYVFERQLGYMEINSVDGKLYAFSEELYTYFPLYRYKKGQLHINNVPSFARQHQVSIIKKSRLLQFMEKIL